MQTLKNTEKQNANENAVLAKTTKNALMQINENSIETATTNSGEKPMRDESGDNLPAGLTVHSGISSRETLHGMNLIDSTAKDLHSYMQSMFVNQPEKAVRTFDPDKIHAAVNVGRAINELMRTKLEAIKLYNNISEGK